MNNLKQKVKEGYNKAAENYNCSFRDQFKNNRHLDLLTEKLSPNSFILDLGCGAGKPVDSYLINKGMRVHGIDISEEQIKLAKQFVPDASYEVGDMSEVKKGEYQADAVVSFYAIFHLPRKTHKKMLEKIKSFLKPKGYLLITMGSTEWEGTEEFCGTDMSWSHYGKDKNLQLIKKAGFKVLYHEIDASGNEQHLVVLAQVE